MKVKYAFTNGRSFGVAPSISDWVAAAGGEDIWSDEADTTKD
jgi:hypothetical protein